MQRSLCLHRAVCRIHVTAVTVRTPARASALRSSPFSHSLRSSDVAPLLHTRLVSSSRTRSVSAMAASLFDYTVKVTTTRSCPCCPRSHPHALDHRSRLTCPRLLQDTTGSDVDLADYKGKVVLVTNVASALLAGSLRSSS